MVRDHTRREHGFREMRACTGLYNAREKRAVSQRAPTGSSLPTTYFSTSTPRQKAM